MNTALLAKWFWKLENENGLWQTVLLNKYVGDGCLSRAKPNIGDSQFCTNILKVKIFYQFYKKKLGDGKNTKFWEDIWVDGKPLKRCLSQALFSHI